MSLRSQSYFNKTVVLIQQYHGVMPLVNYLKQYFAQNKKHGSKDRKFISHLCYCYYRLGHALNEMNIEERLKIAIFLCNDEAGEWIGLFDEIWLNNWSKDLNKRVDYIKSGYPSFSIDDIFPWKEELSEGIDSSAFSLSHVTQPDLFLRIRPGKEDAVMKKLKLNDLTFRLVSPSSLALPNGSKVDTILKVDEEVVIQDYSSQRIAEFLKLTSSNLTPPASVWDACAASGGKSILAIDLLPGIQLTVSDVRTSILQNLKSRFEKAGIKQYKSFITDLTANPQIPAGDYWLILCDAPCSGSGTWGRSPEHLYFFSPEKIDHYADLQKKIVSNSIPHLSEGGYFLYSTCSVFRKENEDTVNYIQHQFPSLKLIKQEVLKGYTCKADSMFAALFQKA
jgi:16S rRNA (cytosine967-C5)-methyltransferase